MKIFHTHKLERLRYVYNYSCHGLVVFQTIARRLSEAKNSIPHFYEVYDINMSAVLQYVSRFVVCCVIVSTPQAETGTEYITRCKNLG